MWKSIVIISMAVSAFSLVAAPALEGAAERDPFYPSPTRPGAAAPRPSGTEEGSWGVRDPFDNPLAGKGAAPKGPAASEPGLALTGIIYSQDVRLAIFGGETYQEGGKIGDRKLVDIRRRSVVLMSAIGEKEEVFLQDFTMNK